MTLSAQGRPLSHLTFAYATLLALASAQPAFGQAFVGLGFTPPYNPQNDIIARQLNGRDDNSSVERRTASQRVIATSALLSFQPSLAARKRNFAQFVAKTRAIDPSGANQLEQMLASTDVISAVGRGIAPMGLRVDNVADAYTVYWMTAWAASKSMTDARAGRAQSAAVKRQAASALLSTLEFTNTTASQKQEFAEALLIQAALIQASVDKYALDEAMLAKVATSVRQGAKVMGLDLEKMTLTPNGFVATGKSGAVDVDALPGSPTTPDSPVPQQTASVPAPAGDDSRASYALIAAAGGAGIAAVFLAGKAMGKKG